MEGMAFGMPLLGLDGLAMGVYLVRMRAGDGTALGVTRKIVIVR